METERASTWWERALPWVVGLVGAAWFLRFLIDDPSGSVLERTFWYDAQYSIDAIAALHRAFAEGPQGRDLLDWLYDDRFYFPQPRPLVISELVPWVAVATWPLRDHPVLAYNTAMFAASVLNVVAGHAFGRALGASRLASLLPGITLAFGAYANFSSGRLQLLMLFPLGFGLAALLRYLRDRRTRDAILVGVHLFVAAGTCLYYAMFLGLVAPFVAIVVRLSDHRPGFVRDVGRLLASMAAATLPLAWFLSPYRDMSVHLGLAHKISDIRAQSGDPMFLGWADFQTLAGFAFTDVYRWDTAYWPGLVGVAAGLAALWRWMRTDRLAIVFVVLPFVLGLPLSLLMTVNVLFVGFVVGLVYLVQERRWFKEWEFSVPIAVLALVTITWFLWAGPYAPVFGRETGPSPYLLLVEHAPFFSGLRMVRRAGVLLTLLVSSGGALTLTTLERRKNGWIPVAVLLALALVETMPWRVATKTVPETCEDEALQAARGLGARVVGEETAREYKHHEKTIARHAASVCGLSTTLGPPNYDLPLAKAVADRIAALPDPAAHAALWDLGIRHVVLRAVDTPRWVKRRASALLPIAARTVETGRDVVIALVPPTLKTATRPESGTSIRVREVHCLPAFDCARLNDGHDDARWTSRHTPTLRDQVALEFDATEVTGLEWHHFGFGADLPPGFFIESREADGSWVPWATVVPDIAGLGREAVRAVTSFALPPRVTTGLRLRPSESTGGAWWSGTEVVPVGRRVPSGAELP